MYMRHESYLFLVLICTICIVYVDLSGGHLVSILGCYDVIMEQKPHL